MGLFRALKTKYEAEQKEMARLQGFVDRFGAQVRGLLERLGESQMHS